MHGLRIRPLARTLVACALAILMTPALAPAIADAYQLTGQKWCDNNATVSLYTDPSLGNPYVLDKQTFYGATSSWENVGAGQMGGKVNFDFILNGENVSSDITVFSSNFGDNGQLALARWSYWPNNCLISANIEFNLYFGWNPPTTSCNFTNSWYTLRGVSLHELGHTVGIAHSGDSSAVMYATFPICTHKGLNGDDEAAIIAVYGRVQ